MTPEAQSLPPSIVMEVLKDAASKRSIVAVSCGGPFLMRKRGGVGFCESHESEACS